MIKNEKPFRGSSPKPDHIMLSINGNPESSMTITWRTSIDIKNGYVEYWQDDGDILKADTDILRADTDILRADTDILRADTDILRADTDILRAEADTDVFKSDIDISNMYWCTLKELKADTKYYYTCGDENNRSEVFFFSTAPKDVKNFKFICISDHQKTHPHHTRPDYSILNKFLKDVLKDHPDTRFILTGGDNTDCGQHEAQWNGLFEGLKGVIENYPLMMTVGNHDDRGFEDYENYEGRYYSDPAEFFSNQFRGSYPYNGPEGWKTANYAFDYGNVHINVLGTSGQEDVRDWVIDELKDCKQDFMLGAYHFPICYTGADCQNHEAYPLMREAFESFDLVFSGHEHNFSRSFPLKNEELFDKPSEGTIHYQLGNSHQNPPGSRTLQKVWHAAFYPQEEMLSCVCIAEVEGKKMTLTSVLEDGRIVDKCIINKEDDTILPYAQPPIYNRTRMKFKGMDLGLCQVDTPCIKEGETWYAPLAILFAYMGAYVEKLPSAVKISAYGKTAVFEEGSDIAKTDKGEVKLPANIIRRQRGQLYMPCDACHIFGLRWNYSPRNNFMSFEVKSQEHLVTEQP